MSVTNCLFFYFLFLVLICSALFVSLLSDLDIFVFTKDRFNVMFIIDLCLIILFCFVLFFFRNLFGTLLSLQPQIPSAGGQGESREEKVGGT